VQYDIAIVVVHHARKQGSEDLLDVVLGSTAMQGAVDTLLVLDRNRGESTDEAKLYISGRDIEEAQELLLTFNRECATWTIKGDAEEYASTPERQAILSIMKEYGKPITAKELANRLEKNLYTVRNLIASLRKEGKIILQKVLST
jgi:YesN/AraC family two-component response regulator